MDILKIRENLEQLPQKIRTAGNIYVEAKNVAENAKLKLEVALSMATLESKETNATRQKAYAVARTQQEKREYFKAVLAEERAKTELEYLNNSFIATRKIASLYEQEMKSGSSGF